MRDKLIGRRTLFARLFACGAVVVLAYHLLSALDVGKFGDQTDIGGGAIALVGYGATGVGAIGLLLSLIAGRIGR